MGFKIAPQNIHLFSRCTANCLGNSAFANILSTLQVCAEEIRTFIDHGMKVHSHNTQV